MPKEGEVGCRLVTGDVVLELVWVGDRYEHGFHSGDLVLRSAAPKPWRSPVYTELHRQDGLLFVSGGADHCHWSASIEPDDHGFVFDVACRVAKGAVPLGGGYLGAGFTIEPLGGDEQNLAVSRGNTGSAWVFECKKQPSPPETIRFRYRVSVDGAD